MSEQPDEKSPRVITGETDEGRTFVLSDNGMAVADSPEPKDEEADGGEGAEAAEHPTAQVEEPAKVMRIGAMVRKLLDEVKAEPLDDPSRDRLNKVYQQSVRELTEGLSPELAEELQRITEPFSEGATTDAELRIAQAQLVGWLEGLFQGIQTALFAQQMAARSQLEQMRRALPPGAAGPGGPGGPGAPEPPQSGGLYL